MTCKNCGAEIADKALICYRCGASTFEPPARPSTRPARRPSLLLSVLALLVLVTAGLFMSQAMSGEAPRTLGYILLALAAVVVVWRVLGPRRS